MPEPTEFTNPYYFVPLSPPNESDSIRVTAHRSAGGKVTELNIAFSERPQVTHDRYVTGTYSGRIVCKLTTETPLVIGAGRTPASTKGTSQPATVHPYLGIDGRPAIPASTLRGLISSIYEAVTHSALRVLSNQLLSVRVPAEPGKPLPHLGIRVPGGIQKLNLGNRWKVKGYEKRAPDELMVNPVSFLGTTNPDSTSADHGADWYVPQSGNPKDAKPSPSSKNKTDVRGVLRVLGIAGREKKLPMMRKQELFVPYLKEDVIYPVTPEAWSTFHELADQRTAEDPDLPFQVKGAARNSDLTAKLPEGGIPLRPRVGDLVYFREEGGKVTEVAVSQIWRRKAGETYEFFQNISKDLLPFNEERGLLTLAEQVFGFVQVDPKDRDRQQLGYQARALASRLRFGEAKLTADQDQPFHTYENGSRKTFILKELSSPKPPCPSMYFTSISGSIARLVEKTSLHPSKHKPNGRKFYVHRLNGPSQPGWETKDGDPGAKERKASVAPLKVGLEFSFTIDFDNLTDRELGFLLYALRPAPEFRHKLGLGKPLGLGQVRLDISEVQLVDRRNRYETDDPFSAPRSASHAGDSAFVDALRAAVERCPTLEQIGNPTNTVAPMHYPQTAGIAKDGAEFEQNIYEWFVACETDDEKPLPPLAGAGALPKLRRLGKHQGE